MELDDDSAASSDYSLLGRMYKSKSLPGPGMEIIFTHRPSPSLLNICTMFSRLRDMICQSLFMRIVMFMPES